MKPNVLFIMADQHHAGRLACCGDPVISTPHHDRIASEGIRFTRAYANSPICGPSRTCFFSGRYGHQHGVFGNFGVDPHRSRWMTDHFRRNGYTTAGIGKMHMGYQWIESELDYVRNESLVDAPPNDPLGRAGAHYQVYLRDKGLLRRSRFFDARTIGGDWMGCTWDLSEEHSPEAWVGRETVAYLKNRPMDKPFFLHVSFPRPHPPLLVPEPFASMYDPVTIPLPPNAGDDFQEKSPGVREKCARSDAGEDHNNPYHPSSKAELQKTEAHYNALISLNDKYIGVILDEIEAQGVLDDTIVVFTADHGDLAGEHGFHTKNLSIYEAIHRIPLLIRYPRRIAAGRITDLLIESVDFYPTLCELAGLPAAPKPVAGRSVLAALDGSEKWRKTAAVCEGIAQCTLRTERARMLFSPDGRWNELYDILEDPWEMNNVWNSPSHSGLRESMMQTLLGWHIETAEHSRDLVPEGSTVREMMRLMPYSNGPLSYDEFLRRFFDL